MEDETVTLSITAGAMQDDNTMKVQVSVVPPAQGTRRPVDMVCIIDISGSMGMDATIQGASGTAESHGLSLLDVAKHGVRTISNSLEATDRLAVVTFNHMSEVVFPLTTMDETGKALAEQKLDQMTHGGATDIWQGLDKGLQCLSLTDQTARFGHVMLLTDGESQDRDNIIPKLMAYKNAHEGLPGTINTFGFGYNLDSKLLVNLASAGLGSYSFIPDAGFVGTAFVSMMSQSLVTMAQEVKLNIEKPAECSSMTVYGGLDAVDKGDFLSLSLGGLQFGQSRDVVLQLKLTGEAEIAAAGEYKTLSGVHKIETVMDKLPGASSGANDLTVEEQWCRSHFVDAIRRAMDFTLQQRTNSASNVDQALKAVTDAADAVQASPATGNPNVQALLQDMLGQSTEALSRLDYYNKWGLHYLPSVMFAHKLQICNNFKDPGVQNYGGPLFRDIREKADEIFCNLPAPKPTARSYGRPAYTAAPVSMAAYHDAAAGCVDGNSIVQMADGSLRTLAELVKGDRVVGLDADGSRAEAELECLVRNAVPGGRANLVTLEDGLRLTPHHPVFVDGAWRFPIDLAAPVEVACEAVYSFVLKGAPALSVGGVACVALGHGIEEGAAAHPYFGSRRSTDDMERLPGYVGGIVEPAAFVRDPETGLVCGVAA